MSKWIIDSNGVCNTSVAGNAYSFGKNHLHYNKLLDALRHNNTERFEFLYEISSYIENYSEGSIEVRQGQIYWDNYPMPELFAERVVDMSSQGVNFQPMLNFLDNLSDNPSDRSIVELFDFLQHKHLPITPDGHFLAYKAVRGDFKDIYTGKFCNKVGNIVEVHRQDVDSNRENGCGNGLHVGSIDYVLDYGHGTRDDDGNINSDNGNQFLVCKVNPKDVVSVPTDCKYQKLRTCRYEVVEILKTVYSKAVVGVAQPIQVKRIVPTPEIIRKISRVSKLLSATC